MQLRIFPLLPLSVSGIQTRVWIPAKSNTYEMLPQRRSILVFCLCNRRETDSCRVDKGTALGNVLIREPFSAGGFLPLMRLTTRHPFVTPVPKTTLSALDLAERGTRLLACWRLLTSVRYPCSTTLSVSARYRCLCGIIALIKDACHMREAMR